jgi:type VI secretion system protein ImpK
MRQRAEARLTREPESGHEPLRALHLTRDALTAIEGIGAVDATADAARAREALEGLLRGVRARAPQEGLSAADADDALFALVALADEVALGRPDPFAARWSEDLLQVRLFGQNVAGDEFFVRLERLLGRGERRDALLVYYLCLVLGFQGRYGVRGGEAELLRITDRVRQALGGTLDPPAVLAPLAERPDEALARGADRNPWLWGALGVVCLSALLYVGLRLSLASEVEGLLHKLGGLPR